MPQKRLVRSALLALAVTAVYFTAGRIGLSLASFQKSASPIWPPTGIALAALLLGGPALWPGIFVGAFLVNLTTSGALAASIVIAAGNTLEAVTGALLVRRFAGGLQAFDRPSTVFRATLFAGLLATTISPTLGVTALALAGQVPSPLPTWFTWWLGDATGALIVAPLILLWVRPPHFRWTGRRRVELGAFAITLVLLDLVIYGGVVRSPGTTALPYYLQVPVLLWAAYRFSARESVTAVAVHFVFATVGTLQGFGPFATGNVNSSLVLVDAFALLWGIVSLTLNSAVSRQNQLAENLRTLNEQLEVRVSERTEQLRETNESLRAQMVELATTEEQLRMSGMRLREAHRLARVGSWELDVESGRLWLSEELCEILGVPASPEPSSWSAYLERIPADDRDVLRRAMETACRQGTPLAIDHRLLHADGAVLGIQTRGHVVSDGHGHALRVYGTAQDLTERHSTEAERAQLIREQAARREAVLANQLKDEFLAVLSHELRNPLNAIVVWSQILLDRRVDEVTARQAIEAIARNAQVQAKLISDLLDLSRLNSGRLELRAHALDPTAVVAQAVDTMRPSADARRVALATHIETMAEPLVHADPERLQQIVWNLISNAIHFSPENGTVVVQLRADARTIELKVVDEGPGISPELLPVVFDATRRGATAQPGRSGGLGLGLAIVRRLAELHGGSVSATNRTEGTGAVLTVRLPRLTPAEARALAPALPGDRGEANVEETLRGLRVLLVEDDPDSAEGLAQVLTRHGVRVTTAGTCGEALDHFDSAPPQVLISDIALPDGDGYGLLERVRTRRAEDGGKVPAIALTAYAGAEHSRRATRAGFQAHVAKPFENEELIALIARLAEELHPSLHS